MPPAPLEVSRVRRLFDELAFAVGRTDRDVLTAWGGRSAGRLVRLGAGRVGGLAAIAGSLGRGIRDEAVGIAGAHARGSALTHVGDRTAAAIDASLTLGQDSGRIVSALARALAASPKDTAPQVLSAFLGFYAGPPGSDGRIPELKVIADIAAQRALLTRTALAGILSEAALLAIADLATLILQRLPADHDPLWDALAKAASPLSGAIAEDTRATIARDLLVDARIEPAPPRDRPVLLSPAAPGDAGPAPGKTPGRKVVDGIATAAQSAQSVAQAAASTGAQHLGRLWRRYGKRP